MSLPTHARLKTHAKVNLFLRVVGQRPDGYHLLETVLQSISLYDEIEIDISDDAVSVDVQWAPGRAGELPAEDENIVTVAASRLLERAGSPRGASIRMKKQIPVGAGLGGGSANAAGALVVLTELWGLELERASLLALASEIGSDVPYCLEGGIALATQRGEELTQLAMPDIPMWFVLGGSDVPLSTRDVYEAWDELDGTPLDGPHSAPLALALGAGDLAEVGVLLHNDLEPAAFMLLRELEAAKEKIATAGVLGAAMSGSGPTMFALVDGPERAREVAARIEDDFAWVEVVQSRPACLERLD